MKQFLESSQYIDWKTPEVQQKAVDLAGENQEQTEIVKICFEFVRDEILHSWDYRMNPVTLRASEVLIHRTGYCYAKSHLLAALLRANGIPAALCYQRLRLGDDPYYFSLHGLNAVYLNEYGWVRVDARGNKDGVNADFDPPGETLAFDLEHRGEYDVEGRFAKPLDPVVETLTTHKDVETVMQNLPDLES